MKMKTPAAEAWIHGALLALFFGLLCIAGRACRTETDCECRGSRDCGECITYQERFALQEEVQTNLNAIYVAELAYFSNANTYAPNFWMINWYPLADHYYAYFLPQETIQPDITQPYSLPAGLAPAVDFLDFTAVAVGNIDCDTVLDVWTINDAKVIENLVNDVVE